MGKIDHIKPPRNVIQSLKLEIPIVHVAVFHVFYCLYICSNEVLYHLYIGLEK